MEEWKKMELENTSLCLTDLDFSDLETFLHQEPAQSGDGKTAIDRASLQGASAPPPPPSGPPPPPPPLGESASSCGGGPPPPPPPPPSTGSPPPPPAVLSRLSQEGGPPPPPPPPGAPSSQQITCFSNPLQLATRQMERPGGNMRKMKTVRVRQSLSILPIFLINPPA